MAQERQRKDFDEKSDIRKHLETSRADDQAKEQRYQDAKGGSGESARGAGRTERSGMGAEGRGIAAESRGSPQQQQQVQRNSVIPTTQPAATREQEPEGSLNCKACGGAFASREELDSHNAEAHPDGGDVDMDVGGPESPTL